MAKCARSGCLRAMMVIAGVILLTGCDAPAGLSTMPGEFTSFLQQFAREALAAFLL